MKRLVLACFAPFWLGCMGAPTPLAPGIHGTMGVPHNGSLTGGQALPKKGDGYRLLRDNDVRWGTPRLVGAIQRAAAAVAKERPGSPPLYVGDLAAKKGGQVSGHSSHRTGRDADLLFYALTPSGVSVRSPGFPRFGPDGLAKAGKGYVRLDVERNWLLIRALVSDEQVDIQWLFVAKWLEALIIEYAIARGEPDEVIYRASLVLHQPGDALPHDDHLHLRVACSPEEAVAGCSGGGPRWPWQPSLPKLTGEDDASLLQALLGDGASGGGAAAASPP